jgi:two-component system phosphate regulon response regulator PhoB
MARDCAHRLLVAESEPALRRLIVQRFTREGHHVLELADAALVPRAVSALDPHAVLLELGGQAGFDSLLRLREMSDVAVIGLLWTDASVDEAVALDLGADDCLARPVSLRLLVARTEAVLRRSVPARLKQLRFGELEIDLGARTVRVGNRPIELTAREFDLLAFLASHPDEVFTRDQLLASVWRSSSDWQQRETVTEHVHRIRARLEAEPSNPRWLRTVRGVGYRFASAAPARSTTPTGARGDQLGSG